MKVKMNNGQEIPVDKVQVAGVELYANTQRKHWGPTYLELDPQAAVANYVAGVKPEHAYNPEVDSGKVQGPALSQVKEVGQVVVNLDPNMRRLPTFE